MMPKGTLPNEPPVEGVAKRTGVKYVAAGGARMGNVGDKKANGKKDGTRGISWRAGAERSHIANTVTGEWMPLKEERGTFLLEVDWLEPEVSQRDSARASGCPRQGK